MKAYGDNVILKISNKTNQTASGLFINNVNSQLYEVVSIGEKAKELVSISVGDIVVTDGYVKQKVDTDLYVFSSGDILAVIE